MLDMKSKSSGKSWTDLAEDAARKTDPEKLSRIVEELCGVLDKRQALDHLHSDPQANKSA